MIQDANGDSVVVMPANSRTLKISGQAGVHHLSVRFPALWLRPGVYSVYFKLLGAGADTGSARYFSESIMLDVTGNDDPEMLLGTITPEASWEVSDSVALPRSCWQSSGGWGLDAAMPDFYVHPADLEQRRKRCVPEARCLLKLQREVVISCNVCGSPRHAILNTRDRYGLPFRNAVCLDCGLFYLIDRFISAGIPIFTAGAYRTISCEFNGVTHTIAQVQADQASYAKNLIGVLSGFVPRRSRRKASGRGRQRRNRRP